MRLPESLAEYLVASDILVVEDGSSYLEDLCGLAVGHTKRVGASRGAIEEQLNVLHSSSF